MTKYVSPDDYTEPTTMRMVITPELARAWLARNKHNRKTKLPQQDAFVRDMKAGAWLLTGDLITFGTNGVLLNGQNRLMACVTADVPFESFVGFGFAPTAQEGMDRGAKRTVGDVLKLAGVSDPTNVGTSITMYIEYERAVAAGRGVFVTHRQIVTPREAHECLERRPDLPAATTRARRLYKKTGLPIGMGAALALALADIDAADAEFFLARLEDGRGLSEGDPILALRNKLTQNHGKHFSQKMKAPMVWAITVKAWNFYRDGTSIKSLGWQPGGSKPEPVPMPR